MHGRWGGQCTVPSHATLIFWWVGVPSRLPPPGLESLHPSPLGRCAHNIPLSSKARPHLPLPLLT